ncbi:MAG TPA: helix-turn-helix domain-containing protein [Candidatus Dormibacteraeota bacterium]|jgi:DNA-binding transcriptional ArsR family regulator|nr:helix-turn-helix domain-containing protein [Candidatus Dormibacteraeota bacterium]
MTTPTPATTATGAAAPDAAAAEDPCVHDALLAGPVAIPEITVVLGALADPMRMAIVRGLAEDGGERICNSFGLAITKSTLSHHFRVLREAGIIEQRLDGTRKLTSLRRADLDAVYPGLLDSVLRAPAPAGAAPQG